MKFSHLIEYHLRYIRHEKKNTQNMVKKLVSDPFKIRIEHIFRSIIWSFIQLVFIVSQIDGC